MTEPAGWIGARLLLKRLRGLMAAGGSAQERLDQIVKLIARDMVAEVCSAYLLRAGEMLELFATEGLNPEAVHKTRLRVGEGLIGDIAAHGRPLALSDAWSHPSFVYRPETGEDLYRSLMGVPVNRDGRVLGVLAIQNKATRPYGEEEVEALETVAMVLAELIASGELISPTEVHLSRYGPFLPTRFDGMRLAGGIAIGEAVLHRQRIIIRQMIAEDTVAEEQRFKRAVAAMQSAIDQLLATDLSKSREFREIMESYRMFAEDRGWIAKIRETIMGGLTAEAAVQKVQNDMRARMREISDPYLRERLYDLEDLTSRLLLHLTGAGPDEASPALPENTILIARNLGPAELLSYNRSRLKGVVLEDGSLTSHVAIIARSLDIPVVMRVKDVLDQVERGDLVIVDGDRAQVYLRPSEAVQESLHIALKLREEEQKLYQQHRDQPAITRDGMVITLSLNAGIAGDVAALDNTGAAGIALFRTEIAHMLRPDFPSLAEQTQFYRSVLEEAGDRPVVFRMLDFGGDKPLPYFNTEGDENPAMGWRALRIARDRPSLFKAQLRALIAAAASRSLAVMFPMVSELKEFIQGRALLNDELATAAARGQSLPHIVRVGAMLEVPALVWQLDELLPMIDFLSIGTNDLAQFFFASDRGSVRLAERYDCLSPAFLRLLKQIAVRGAAHGTPLTICGEMAAKPLDAIALIGLGYRHLSMASSAIGPVKAVIRTLELGAVESFVRYVMTQPVATIRPTLRAFAKDRGYFG